MTEERVPADGRNARIYAVLTVVGGVAIVASWIGERMDWSAVLTGVLLMAGILACVVASLVFRPAKK